MISKRLILCVFLLCFSTVETLFAAERVYTLRVQDKTVNFTGEPIDHAMAVNGSIPAPTLKFNFGDKAVIHVINETKEPTTMHWHGILVPPDMDGPSFVNNKLIQPGDSFTFRFPIRHTGTFWYHSHTELHEQRGVYGAIVINDRKKKYRYDHDIPVVFSDWTDEHPKDVLANLKKNGEYYAYKKGFLPSLVGAIQKGEFKNYLNAEWTRMGPMDLSDVGYDAFLVNGKKEFKLDYLKPRQTVRLRLINAGASTLFYFNIGKFRSFKVIAKDGVDIVPKEVSELFMGMGETFDVIFTLPSNPGHVVEARATAQDITGHSSLLLGSGDLVERVPRKPKPSPYGMDHSKHGSHQMDHSGHQMDSHAHHAHHGHHQMKKNPRDVKLEYKMLESPTSTAYPAHLKRHDIRLELDGDMERYTWAINGKSFSEEKFIEVRYDEVVRFTFKNNTMMHHPMHLHGHFFRILNGKKERAPLAHTATVSPMTSTTIEVRANEPGIWFFHCHNLYHMKMGMSRLLKYASFKRSPELIEDERKYKSMLTADNDIFFRGEAGVYTNHADLTLGGSFGRYDLEAMGEIDRYKDKYIEGSLHFSRYFSKYFTMFLGGEYEHGTPSLAAGFTYLLPMRVWAKGTARTDEKFEISLEKEIPILGLLHFDVDVSFSYEDHYHFEPELGLHYQFAQWLHGGAFYKFNEKVRHLMGFGARVTF